MFELGDGRANDLLSKLGYRSRHSRTLYNALMVGVAALLVAAIYFSGSSQSALAERRARAGGAPRGRPARREGVHTACSTPHAPPSIARRSSKDLMPAPDSARAAAAAADAAAAAAAGLLDPPPGGGAGADAVALEPPAAAAAAGAAPSPAPAPPAALPAVSPVVAAAAAAAAGARQPAALAAAGSPAAGGPPAAAGAAPAPGPSPAAAAAATANASRAGGRRMSGRSPLRLRRLLVQLAQ